MTIKPKVYVLLDKNEFLEEINFETSNGTRKNI
jgi:hypothetical protein